MDRPDDSISEVWINSDNSDMLIYSSDNLSRQSVYLALGGIVLFIVWLIIYKRSEKVPYNDEVAAGICVLLTVFFIILAIAAKREENRL